MSLWAKFLKLFAAPKGIPPAKNRKERRTRDAIARKQAKQKGLRE